MFNRVQRSHPQLNAFLATQGKCAAAKKDDSDKCVRCRKV